MLIEYPNPILEQIAEPLVVDEFNSEWLADLVKKMEETIRQFDANGLAAPQIGVSKAVIICRDRHGLLRTLCNPEIIARSGKVKSYGEGCLSSPVTEDDTVYHVGDFAFAGPDRASYVEHLLRRLNGTHILILGNHDRIAPLNLVDIGFQSVHTSLSLEREGHLIVMAHDPSIWNCVANMDPLPIFLHGHIHLVWKSIINKKMVNIGVDVWDFYPVSLEQILKALNLGGNVNG